MWRSEGESFSQAVEIPGQVLPAGTYTFKLLDVVPNMVIASAQNTAFTIFILISS